MLEQSHQNFKSIQFLHFLKQILLSINLLQANRHHSFHIRIAPHFQLKIMKMLLHKRFFKFIHQLMILLNEVQELLIITFLVRVQRNQMRILNLIIHTYLYPIQISFHLYINKLNEFLHMLSMLLPILIDLLFIKGF